MADTTPAPEAARPIYVPTETGDDAVVDSEKGLPWHRAEIAGNPKVRSGDIYPVKLGAFKAAGK